MRTAGPLLAAAIAAAALARPAAAQPDPAVLVTRAQREMSQLNFERAAELLERAEASGRNHRDELIVIYRSLGECQASLGRGDEARLAFRRLLALDPDAELPPGSSPKLIAPFTAAQQAMRRRELAVACERSGLDAVLNVLADPAEQVAGGRLLRDDGTPLSDSQPTIGRRRIQLGIPDGSQPALACAVLDRHGNELARAPLLATSTSNTRPGTTPGEPGTADLMPPGDAMPPPVVGQSHPDETPQEGDDAPPFFARWWLWGAASLVAAGTGAYFAVEVQRDEDELRRIKLNSRDYFYQQALDVKARGEQHARYVNIAFGTAGVLATVSTILLIRYAGRSRAGTEASAGVGATPADHGAAATVWFTF